MITLQSPRTAGLPFGYLIVAADGRDILVQSDRDYPGIAATFGWWPGMVPAGRSAVQSVAIGDFRSCVTEHDGTDGTIDCTSCGATAADFIASAESWLDEHIGTTADDPGFFTEG